MRRTLPARKKAPKVSALQCDRQVLQSICTQTWGRTCQPVLPVNVYMDLGRLATSASLGCATSWSGRPSRASSWVLAQFWSAQQACSTASASRKALTCMMGRRSPAMVCMRVIHPLMKKMVPMTAARSSGVPAANHRDCSPGLADIAS